MHVLVAMVCLALAAVSAFAQEEETIVADRPGLADGAATVGSGVVQLETGLTLAGDDEESLTLPTLLRIGFGDRFELRIESDVAEGLSDDVELAPVAAGFKLRLTDGAIPLSIIAGVQPPSGGGRLRTTDFESEARLVSDIELGHGFALTPNVGVAFVEGGDATGVFAMTLEKTLGNALPFVDFETSFGGGDTSLIADAGVAWIVRPNTQLDVSGGVELAGDDYPEWFIAAGFSRRF
ncbi:MAG TPA: transporter [Thermoanaerobaculia bacterium]|nr:transporter [Thermoanaerobaculia bacterium]